MYEFRMPSLGADMEAGTLSRWLVKPGDRVKRGDVVAIVETEKSDIEVEIWGGGVVDRLAVAERQRVPVGALLAVLRDAEPAAETAGPPPRAGAAAPSEPAAAGVRASPAARKRAAELGVDLARVTGRGPGGAIQLADVEAAASARPAVKGEPRHVHPLARRVAEALGVDLARVEGTGIGGAVTRADVEAAARAAPAIVPAAAAPASPAPEAVAPAVAEPQAPRDRAAAMRRAIGALMARSKREVPHYYLASRIDLRLALAWLAAANERRPVTERILPAALLIKAVALALREVPELNGFWIDDALRPSPAIHVGVAVALRGGGLIAPALHDTADKSLAEVMVALRDLVQRARAGSLRSSQMSDPTITVTNLGDQGVESVFGVIYPPQVALVGFGKIDEQPWAEGGMVTARPAVTATLSADHRASDGHRGGRFLAAVGRLLQEPEKL